MSAGLDTLDRGLVDAGRAGLAAPPLAPPARRTSWSVGCPGLQRGLGHWIISLSEIVRAYVAGA